MWAEMSVHGASLRLIQLLAATQLMTARPQYTEQVRGSATSGSNALNCLRQDQHQWPGCCADTVLVALSELQDTVDGWLLGHPAVPCHICCLSY